MSKLSAFQSHNKVLNYVTIESHKRSLVTIEVLTVTSVTMTTVTSVTMILLTF